jgi:hypothetical protein
MYTIQLEISGRLAERLAPYQTRLPELLELGLLEWETQAQSPLMTEQDALRQVLAESGKVELPKPYRASKPYRRCTPVPISGTPVSELVIEQRGTL